MNPRTVLVTVTAVSAGLIAMGLLALAVRSYLLAGEDTSGHD